ncbi:EAL domain-containing protein [Acidithiobacillus caldus]|uniref:EAL domain-containing protein n=1 Tax=Acidithiobacillus caldus TaxID=33059 RepID=A0A1E7YJ17_9PROT|nr:EAL domain-containing protein [Acidithiobacillus caldus]OFC28664.1 hypothetical protein BAE27_15340 [Acidithiobacillus caldus]OFC37994.1 hypothetical protein BAE28_06505 [Acidithiobacillus caldus]OFC38950.1 hypothetical protein BAE29_08110 [Acidithiobacillus caldus]
MRSTNETGCKTEHCDDTSALSTPVTWGPIAGGRLCAFYQPILDSRTLQIVSAEALVRLVGPDGRIYSPAQFLPEDNDEALRQVTQFMLETAPRAIGRLDAEGFVLGVSINVVPRLLAEPICRQHFREILDGCPLPLTRLTLELLESSDFLNRDGAVRILHDMTKTGVRLALDDLGTGYSSLARLRDLPIREMKLDFSFVRELPRKPADLHFLIVLKELAERLHCDFVAEGVETLEILDAMLVLRVPFLQGFAIAQPMSFSKLREFLHVHDKGFDAPRPGTLGVYACVLCHDRHLRRLIEQQPMIIANSRVIDVRTCPVDRQIRVAGLSGSPLDHLHRRYHVLLAQCAERHALRGRCDGQELDYVQTNMEEWLASKMLDKIMVSTVNASHRNF